MLIRLSHDGLVEIHPNRGAFVASPDSRRPGDLRGAARIEAEVVRIVAKIATREQLGPLRRNVEQEAVPPARTLRDAIRLSGEFHTLLGDFCGQSHSRDRPPAGGAHVARGQPYENQNTMSCWHDDHCYPWNCSRQPLNQPSR